MQVVVKNERPLNVRIFMQHIIIYCLLVIKFLSNTIFCVQIPAAFFSLHSTATWREYSLKSPKIHFLKEKWAWAYSLVLKSKNPVKLTTITLQWKGNYIEQLSASLYVKKERDRVVIPIQKNLVCDGIWEQKKQQLSFNINDKIIAVNKYHLLLSFPKNTEKILKKGIFVIAGTKASGFIKPLTVATRTYAYK